MAMLWTVVLIYPLAAVGAGKEPKPSGRPLASATFGSQGAESDHKDRDELLAVARDTAARAQVAAERVQRREALAQRREKLLDELGGVHRKLEAAQRSSYAAAANNTAGVTETGWWAGRRSPLAAAVFSSIIFNTNQTMRDVMQGLDLFSWEHMLAFIGTCVFLFFFGACVAASWNSTPSDVDDEGSRGTVSERIKAMGAQEEYEEFRDRYNQWIRGAQQSTSVDVHEPGFGDLYHDVAQWRWRRTLSYWIAITFFIGSLFFTASSVFGCYAAFLGDFKWPLTTGGYLAGKAFYLACCYMMCVETVNMGAESDGSLRDDDRPPHGCLAFTVGFAAELCKGLPEVVAVTIVRWAFLVGSLMFVSGGVMECVENNVFTKGLFDRGSCGAFLNTIGGVGFLVGSALEWVPGTGYWQNFNFAWGSIFFVVGSSVMIIMWQNEQFGLCFLAKLNLGETGMPVLPVLGATSREVKALAGFSPFTIIFIHVYCVTICCSVYNFNNELTRFMMDGKYRRLQFAFYELVPSFVSLVMLALRSAVNRTPQGSPYFQIFLGVRILSMLMVCNSMYTVYWFVHEGIQAGLAVERTL